MGNIFTLDALREEAEREFAPTTITLSDGTEVVLQNLLRLKKRDRKVVLEKLKVLEAIDGTETSEETDEIELLAETATEILELVADKGQKLLRELDGDVSIILKVLNKWMESTQPGEAQPSPA